jgi:hypothetical protein
MRSCHTLDGLEVTIDDERLVANAGLMLPATLTQRAGVRELIDDPADLGDGAAQCRSQGDDFDPPAPPFGA